MTTKNSKMTMTGSYVQVIGRGRAWVESVDLDTQIARVRFDSNQGRRSRVHEFAFDAIDFENHVNGWKVLGSR